MSLLLLCVILLSTQILGGDAAQVIGCPNTILSLNCPSDTVIKIIAADYGRHSTTLCPYSQPSAMQNTTCSLDETRQYEQQCDGYQSCEINVNIQTIDPCVGTYKYLTVTYVCNAVCSNNCCNGCCNHPGHCGNSNCNSNCNDN